MRRSALLVALVCALSVAGASVASAQDEGFKATTTDVGPVIGLGGLSGAGAGFGGRFEKGFKELPNLRDGVLGIGISVDFFSFGTTFFTSGYNYKVIPIAVTVNYHLKLDNKKIDPFFGAGLGYEHFSVSGPSCIFAGVDYCSNAGYSSGVYFVGHAGIRYYWQPKLALYADVGSGAGSLHVGIMFKIAE
jgi:hypothetical protein